MTFDYQYFWKPVLILALCAYFILVYSRFWSDCLKKRNSLFDQTTGYKDPIMIPIPDTRLSGHPNFSEYQAYFRSGALRAGVKIVLTWVVIAVLAQT